MPCQDHTNAWLQNDSYSENQTIVIYEVHKSTHMPKKGRYTSNRKLTHLYMPRIYPLRLSNADRRISNHRP